jgi:hypothetical protein
MSEEYERILLVKPDVFIYKIPPRTTNRGYRASDWKLDEPDWTGRMRVVAKGKECSLKIEDKTSGQLFAECPIDKYPGLAIEAVSDSSRYFVIKIVDDNGRSAFIGIGFADRGDSFDVMVALQDHFKWLEKQEEIEKSGGVDDTTPKLDLGFKEGQTIKVNLNIKKNSSGKAKPKGTGILLPPPGSSGGIKLPPPSTSASKPSYETSTASKPTVSPSENAGTGDGLLLEFDGLNLGKSSGAAEAAPKPTEPFAASTASNNSDWAQF